LFLMPVWRALGKSTKLFRGRTLPKTVAAIVGAAAIVSVLCFLPWDFKLKGDAQLKPTLRQHVWAEADGYVQQVNVAHDQLVIKDQVLVVQESTDLDKEMESLNGELQKAQADLKSTRNSLDYNDELTEVERSEMESHNLQLNATVASLQKQLALQQKKKEKLQVRSPMDGRVVTWNVEDRLRNRPVNLGEELLEIADPTGPWELEVTMPESRMGHIAKALAEAEKAGKKLPVTFILALNPGEDLYGTVEEVHRSAEVRGDSGNTVLVRVSFDQKRLREVVADPKIGHTATAKIHCGKRALGYVWFHDLIDFVRAKILFRIF